MCVCVCLFVGLFVLFLKNVALVSSGRSRHILYSFLSFLPFCLCLPHIISGKDDGPAPSISGRPKESRHDITPAPVYPFYLFLVTVS